MMELKQCKRCVRLTLGWAPSGADGGCDYCPYCVAEMLAEDDAAIEAAYAAGAEEDRWSDDPRIVGYERDSDPRTYEAEADPRKYDQD